MAVKIVIFDLGGVIIRLGEHIFPREWLTDQSAFSLKEWLHSDVSKAFETGAISAFEFGQALKIDLGLGQSVEEIVSEFAAWPEALFEGSAELLTSLSNKYTLVALSNINELHAPRMLDEFHLHEYFDQLLFSHELGLAKPDPNIYLKALELLEVAPHEVVFFDDLKRNVDAAIEQGINSHQVFGPDAVRDCLKLYESE